MVSVGIVSVIQRSPSSTSVRRVLVLTAVLALAGAACSSDAADSSPTTVSPPTTAATTATTAAETATTDGAATAETSPEGGPVLYDIVGTALLTTEWTAGVAFTRLAGLAVDAGLVEALRGGPFTVFAPTDAAFAKVPNDIVHKIQSDNDLLTRVVTYHVIEGSYTAADLPDGEITTLSGDTILVEHMGDVTYINGNAITLADVAASNGTIHVMSDVLVPSCCGDIIETATALPGFGTLATLVTEAGLVDTLKGDGPFTVFAPTDDALAKLPADIVDALLANPDLLTTVLTYHVLPGKVNLADLPEGDVDTVAGPPIHVTKVDGVTYINGNPVLVGNVNATNGIIHVLGDALVPPIGDIIDVATTLPGFTTLATLVTQAELIDTLKGDGPFTVFAPVDAAFEALPAATVNAVTSDNDLLTAVLTYHVVAGKLTTADLVDGKLETVSGVELTISHDEDGTLLIDGHPIAVQNVEATNGIIQVMGDVLVPES